MAEFAGIGGSPSCSGNTTTSLIAPVGAQIHYIRGSHAGQSLTSEIVLQMPPSTRQWELTAFALHRTSGTGTTWASLVGQTTNFAVSGPDDRFGLASSAVTTPINKTFCSPIRFRTDDNNRLYFRPRYGSGADNAGVHQFWFQQQFETGASIP